MTKRDIFEWGIDRGYSVAFDVPIPSLCAEILHVNEAYDCWIQECSEVESNSRQYEDFSHVAHYLNGLDKPYDVWEVFEDGIQKGYERVWRKEKSAFDAIYVEQIPALYSFVNIDFEVDAIKQSVAGTVAKFNKKFGNYSALFVLSLDAEYVSVYGLDGIIPVLNRIAFRVI